MILFNSFSLEHLLSLFIFLFIPITLIIIFTNKLKNYKYEYILRYSVISIAILLEFWFMIQKILSGHVAGVILPGFCLFVFCITIIYLITKNEKFYTIAYIGIIGPILSLVMPDLASDTTLLRHIHYFFNHGIQIFSLIYAYRILDMRVKKDFIFKTYLIYLILALFMMVITLISLYINFEPIIKINSWFMVQVPIDHFNIASNYYINLFINDIIWILLISSIMILERLIILKIQK